MIAHSDDSPAEARRVQQEIINELEFEVEEPKSAGLVADDVDEMKEVKMEDQQCTQSQDDVCQQNEI